MKYKNKFKFMSYSISNTFLVINARRKFIRFGAMAFCIFIILTTKTLAEGFTNVTVANVTPSSFTVLWLGSGTTPKIEIFSDENGFSNITTQLEIELYPLKAGSTLITNDYEQRQYKTLLKQQIQNKGIFIFKVSGCKPNTRYYFKLTTVYNNVPLSYPSSPPFPFAKTMVENTFVVEARQVFIEYNNLDSFGSVIVLSHPNTQYPVAAIVGDGCSTNKAVLNVSDMFSISGYNFAPDGSQVFTATVFGAPVYQEFNLLFTSAFAVAKSEISKITVLIENIIVELGSEAIPAGQNGLIPVYLESTVFITNLTFLIQLSSDVIFNPFLISPSEQIETAEIVSLENNLWQLNFKIHENADLSNKVRIINIGFSTSSSQPSTLIGLYPKNIKASKQDGNFIQNAMTMMGRIIVIGQNPYIEAQLLTNNQRQLIIYGKPSSTYQIQSAIKVLEPMKWQTVGELTLDGISGVFPLSIQHGDIVFYRAIEIGKTGTSLSIPSSDSWRSSEIKQNESEKSASNPVKILPLLNYKVK